MIWTRNLIFLVTILLAPSAFSSDGKNEKREEREYDYHYEQSMHIYRAERLGIRAFNEQNYSLAFDKLSFSASKGLKNSQHYLGIMYLKGLHVPVSIETGMAWVGVANEVEIKDWSILYSKIYSRLNNKQKLKVDKRVAEFKEKYGMEAQGIECGANLSAAIKRTSRFRCKKSSKSVLWIEE